MRGRRFMLLVGLMAAALQAPAQFPEDDVRVIVWRDGDRCSVMERKTLCARVPRILQGPLQISRDRRILIYTDGTSDDVMLRASRVSTDIRAAGYRNVMPASADRRP